VIREVPLRCDAENLRDSGGRMTHV